MRPERRVFFCICTVLGLVLMPTSASVLAQGAAPDRARNGDRERSPPSDRGAPRAATADGAPSGNPQLRTHKSSAATGERFGADTGASPASSAEPSYARSKPAVVDPLLSAAKKGKQRPRDKACLEARNAPNRFQEEPSAGLTRCDRPGKD